MKTKNEILQEFRAKVLWAAHNFGGYTTAKNAAAMTGYSVVGSIYALKQMAKAKLMIEHKVSSGVTLILVFTIAKAGRECVAGDEISKWAKAFSINKFRQSTLNHEMTLQRLCARVHKGDDSDQRVTEAKVIGARKIKGRMVGGRRPDAMYNENTTIELELTIKSARRYGQIFEIYNRTGTSSIWIIPEKIVHRFDKILDELLDAEDAGRYIVYSLADNDEFEYSKGHIERKARLEELRKERDQEDKQEAEAEAQQRINDDKERTQTSGDWEAEQAERKALTKKFKILNWAIPFFCVLAIPPFIYGLMTTGTTQYFCYLATATCLVITGFLKYESYDTKKNLGTL